MPKILIKGRTLPKAKNGKVASNGPCEKGYINIDGYCIPISEYQQEGYEIYEIPGKPDYYTTDRKLAGVSKEVLPQVIVQAEDYSDQFPHLNWLQRTERNVGDFLRGGPKSLSLPLTKKLDNYWRQTLQDDAVRNLLQTDPKYYQSLRLEAYRAVGAPETVMEREVCLSNFGYHWDPIKKTCVPDIVKDPVSGEDSYRTVDSEFYKSKIAPTLLSSRAPIRLSKHQDVISSFIPDNELAFDVDWDERPDVKQYKLQYHSVDGSGSYNPILYDFPEYKVSDYANAPDDQKSTIDNSLKEKAVYEYKNQKAVANLGQKGMYNALANNLPTFMGGWDRKAWGSPKFWNQQDLQELVENTPGFDPAYPWQEQIYLVDDQYNNVEGIRSFENLGMAGINKVQKEDWGALGNIAKSIGLGTYNDVFTGAQMLNPRSSNITRGGLNVDDPKQIVKEARNNSIGFGMFGRSPNVYNAIADIPAGVKPLIENPSASTATQAFGSVVSPIWEMTLATPITSSARSAKVASEVPWLTRTGTALKNATLGKGYSNLGNVGKTYRIATSPLRTGKNAFMGYMHGATQATTFGLGNRFPGLGISFRTMEQGWNDAMGVKPFHWATENVLTPALTGIDKTFGIGEFKNKSNIPTNTTSDKKVISKCGEGYMVDPNNADNCIPILPPAYQNQSDTTYNFNLNNGTVFTLDTKNDETDKKIFNFLKQNKILNVDANGYNPETKTWDIEVSKEDEDKIKNIIDLKNKAYGGPTSEIPKLFSYSPETNIPGRMERGGQLSKMNLGGGPKVKYRCGAAGIEAFNANDASQKNPSFNPAVAGLKATGAALSAINPMAGFGTSASGSMLEAKGKLVFDTYEEAYNCCVKGDCSKRKQSFGSKMEDLSTSFDMYTNLASGISNQYANIGKAKENDLSQRRQNLTDNLDVVSTDMPGGRGFYQTNTGIFMPDQLGYDTQNVGMFGGTMLKDSSMNKTIKIKILGGPTSQMAYGGQSGYGFDLGQRNTYTAMPEGKADTVSKTIQEVPREQANIEAEKGETIYADMDGDGMYEHLNIEGQRHTKGGTPLNVPEGSFVFSDTAKMRIKDPEILRKFGLSPRKGGYTPAEIAKKYDVNKYKGILQDPNSDQMMKNTAMLMIKSYQRKLAELALIQESMKGFPQGIPEMCRGVLPDEMLAQIEQQIAQRNPQQPGGGQPGQQQQMQPEMEQPMLSPEEQAIMMPEGEEVPMEEQQPMGRYGGYYAYGGFVEDDDSDEYDDYFGQYTPKMVVGGTPPPDWSQDYDSIKNFLTSADTQDLRDAIWNSYKATTYGAADAISKEDFLKNFLSYQEHIYKLHEKHDPSDPAFLRTADWDSGTKNAKYNTVATNAGLTPLDESGIKRGQYFYKLMTNLVDNDATLSAKYKNKLDINPIGVEDPSQSTERGGVKNLPEPDGWFGNTSNGSLLRMKSEPPSTVTTPVPVKGFKCTGRDEKTQQPVIETKDFKDDAELAAQTEYVKDQTEAAKQCPPKTTPPGTVKIPPPNEVPFKYMTPDKWKMAGAMGAIGNAYYPYIADTQYEAGQFQPEEWRAKASQLESLTKQTGEQMGTYLPGNQSAANLTNMLGQQAGNLIGAIADVDARNIQGWNAFSARELARRDAYRQQRAANATGRATGTAITRQAVDNFLNQKMNNVLNAAANAWDNRMKLGKINETNRYYYTDPISGRTVWKGGYGVEDLGRSSSSGIVTWEQYQKMFPGQTVTPKDYNDYLKATGAKASSSSDDVKYGGSTNRKFNNFGKSSLSQMLENGYGFPY